MINPDRVMSPAGYAAVFIFIAVIALLTATPVADPIGSMEQLTTIAKQLNVPMIPGIVPVIVLTRPGCPHCGRLVDALKKRGLDFYDFDIAAHRAAFEIHTDLGRNYLGTVATRAVPTTIVGLRVVRGNNIDKIIADMTEQASLFR